MTKARKPAPGLAGELTSCHRVLEALGLRQALKDYRPRIVGTMPLGVHTADSDIDVLVEVRDLDAFAAAMQSGYGTREGFVMWRRAATEMEPEAVVVRMDTATWPVEIFAQDRPTVQQTAYRHYAIENRLLRLGGESLRDEIVARKEDGTKTEAAFCDVLGLEGDPFLALLDLEGEPDGTLCDLIQARELEAA